VNYYKRHIGDYAAKAGHLSPLEHGVYTLLIDAYYNREEAPTKAEAIRWARARSASELAAVDAVLAEFFAEVDGRFTQNRIEEELAAYREVAETNRRIAVNREATKRARAEHEACSDRAQTVGGSSPEREPSHKPLAISHKEATAIAPDGCPHAEIIELYHELLPASPRVRSWTDTRRSNLRARWREDAKRQTLDYWRRLFTHCGASAFLTGRATGKDGRPFFMSLDWLVKPENFAKVIEGRYHDKGDGQ
jgi:uncharacterized protein YdaU (DUF1376 family)